MNLSFRILAHLCLLFYNANLLQMNSCNNCGKLLGGSACGNLRRCATFANPACSPIRYEVFSLAPPSFFDSSLDSFGFDKAHCIAHMANGRM